MPMIHRFKNPEVIESLENKYNKIIPNNQFMVAELSMINFRNFYSGDRMFDELIVALMNDVAVEMLKYSGAYMAWATRNRIYLIFEPITAEKTTRLFKGKVLKITGRFASYASIHMSRKLVDNFVDHTLLDGFDCNIFDFHKSSTLLHFFTSEFDRNYLRVRQDAKTIDEDYNDYPDYKKYGSVVYRDKESLFGVSHIEANHVFNNLDKRYRNGEIAA